MVDATYHHPLQAMPPHPSGNSANTNAYPEEIIGVDYALMVGVAFDETDPMIMIEGYRFRHINQNPTHELIGPACQDAPLPYAVMCAEVWDETDDELLIENAGHYSVDHLDLIGKSR